MDAVFGFLVVVGISIFCWFMALKPTFRRNQNAPAYYFWRPRKQERREMDAVSQAFSLVFAMLFSMITLVWVIIAVSRFLSQSSNS